jgi:hypothetical protein
MTVLRLSKVLLASLFICSQVFALDNIPEDLSEWTERGVVLTTNPAIRWEEQKQIGLSGISKVGNTYYLFYSAGFNGCWNADGDSNHQSLGLATSTDGINFTKNANNPVLIPHDFVPVSSHEEGIRTAYVQYIPSKNQFQGYFGVESPGGTNTCGFGGVGNCGCNISVDAEVFFATSVNGKDWQVKGNVSGTYRKNGYEVYASGWVNNGSETGLFVTVAEGAMGKFASRGSNPIALQQLGSVSKLNWGWSGVDAFLHDDNNTITLMYNPSGGNHPGVNNDNLYFATTKLDDMTNIQNERVITTSGDERNIIIKDGNEWKWYYSDETALGNNTIRLRTHPVVLDAGNMPPSAPSKLTIKIK